MDYNTLVDETTLQHGFADAAGLNWHYVEIGQGEPVVLLHGIPESWYCWRYQFEPLAQHFRVIAPDLKGYGQSDKRDGDYSQQNAAHELAVLFEILGLERYYLAGHDWGAGIGKELAALHPDRVIKYCHMSTPTVRYDTKMAPHHLAYANDPTSAVQTFKDAEGYIRWWWETGGSVKGVSALSAKEYARMVEEFSRPGVAEAVARYFRDAFDRSERKPTAFQSGALTMPVRFIYPDSDPRQPLDYVRNGLEEAVPGFERFVVVPNAGHFSMQEQPEIVTKALLEFFMSGNH
ncbi:MAG: alpha/beta hydrolase [Pseudomonadota bacterium]